MLVLMDFWKVYDRHVINPDFDASRFHLASKARPNASLGEVSAREKTVGLNEMLNAAYEHDSLRYIVAREVTYDIVFTLYDVNTARCMFIRATEALDRKALDEVARFARSLKNPNIEMRAIGAQNAGKKMAWSIYVIRKGIMRHGEAALVEVDLFGTDMRHICIDMKTGTTYNLLLENRIYRPGELSNTLKPEEFEPKRGPVRLTANARDGTAAGAR